MLSFFRVAGGRVIGSVMAPLQVPAKLLAASAPLKAARVERYAHGADAALFPLWLLAALPSGTGGGKYALHHNKPMHPTADTLLVKFSYGAGRRVIGGVSWLQVKYDYNAES
jgi:hypothetical protein